MIEAIAGVIVFGLMLLIVADAFISIFETLTGLFD